MSKAGSHLPQNPAKVNRARQREIVAMMMARFDAMHARDGAPPLKGRRRLALRRDVTALAAKMLRMVIAADTRRRRRA